jgi:hypothetical protein
VTRRKGGFDFLQRLCFTFRQALTLTEADMSSIGYRVYGGILGTVGGFGDMNPPDDDGYGEAFSRWCDRAQVAIALRDLYSANKINFDAIIDLASYTASEFGEIATTSATDERPTDELWADEIKMLTDELRDNFERHLAWEAEP